MTSSLKEHLIRCEQAAQSAKPILNQHQFPTDRRTLTVIGFISVLAEHQESILLLLMHDMPGSAFALFRPVIEGGYRALWINHSATDAEVNKFNDKDKIDLDFAKIAAALDNAYGTEDYFQKFKTETWKYLNSYTHGGMHQIGRRFVKHQLANNYSEELIYGMTTLATSIVLLTISYFLKTHGHTESGDQIEALQETFGPVQED